MLRILVALAVGLAIGHLAARLRPPAPPLPAPPSSRPTPPQTTSRHWLEVPGWRFELPGSPPSPDTPRPLAEVPQDFVLAGSLHWPLETADPIDPDFVRARALARHEIPAGWCADLSEGWPREPPVLLAEAPSPDPADALVVLVTLGGRPGAAHLEGRNGRIAFDGSGPDAPPPPTPHAPPTPGVATVVLALPAPTLERLGHPLRLVPPRATPDRGRLLGVWWGRTGTGSPGDDLEVELAALGAEAVAVLRATRPEAKSAARQRIERLEARLEAFPFPIVPDRAILYAERAAEFLAIRRDLSAALALPAPYPGPLRLRDLLARYALSGDAGSSALGSSWDAREERTENELIAATSRKVLSHWRMLRYQARCATDLPVPVGGVLHFEALARLSNHLADVDRYHAAGWPGARRVLPLLLLLTHRKDPEGRTWGSRLFESARPLARLHGIWKTDPRRDRRGDALLAGLVGPHG